MIDPLRPSPFGAARRAFLGAEPVAGSEEAAWERLAAGVERAELAPELLALAWEARGWSGETDPARRDAVTLLVLGALVAREEGSTRVPEPAADGAPVDGADWWDALLARLFGEEAGAPRAALAALAAAPPPGLVGPPGGRTPLIREARFLYLEKVHRAEAELAALLSGLLRAPRGPVWTSAEIEAALGALVAPGRSPLAAEQAQAVRVALEGPLTLISGGPGTGKTWLVVGLLRALLRLGLPADALALAAPTARAAQRLADAIGAAAADPDLPAPERGLVAVPAPATLHRLLGYHPLADRFRHDRERPLPARVVVVDEASMIDLELARALLRALRPGARLVLIGDADQLPSVGAGLVLRDLLPASGGAAGRGVRLVENHRVDAGAPGGRQVLAVARAINAGQAAALLPSGHGSLVDWRDGVAALTWSGVEGLEGVSAALLPPFLARWEAEHLHDPTGDARATVQLRGGQLAASDRPRVERALARHEQARLLCLTRVGPCGAAALNERLHALALGRAGQHAGAGWTAGEPVLVLENDHQLRLWNGEQGVALWVSEDDRPPRLMALFRRGAGHVAYHLELLQQRIDRGYALTVHKAQGSEYRHVAVVLPDRDTPLLARELLYTALTRARASVTLLGPQALLARGLSRAARRWSGLGERLSGS